jgi:hypothetical protein
MTSKNVRIVSAFDIDVGDKLNISCEFTQALHSLSYGAVNNGSVRYTIRSRIPDSQQFVHYTINTDPDAMPSPITINDHLMSLNQHKPQSFHDFLFFLMKDRI